MKEATSQVFHYRTFRTIIGGIAIAIALVTTIVFMTNTVAQTTLENIPTSISVTYHFGARDVFVGMLFIVGAFLVAYKGHNTGKKLLINEAHVATIAGLAAILVALCPTTVKCDYAYDFSYDLGKTVCVEQNKEKTETKSDNDALLSPIKKAQILANIHGIAAVFLIGSLLFFCYRFYKRAMHKYQYDDYDLQIRQKIKKRANVYLCCGLAMVASPVIGLIWERVANVKHSQFIFVIELVCLVAFGVAWLTAGKQIIFTNTEKGSDKTDITDIEETISLRLEKEELAEGNN